MDAVYRLIATEEKEEPSEWWETLPVDQKKEYIDEHPNSKYADQALKEKEEGAQAKDVSPEERKTYASSIRKSSAKISKFVQHSFPKIHQASSALTHLASGKPLDHEQKEVLHELGAVILKRSLTHVVGEHAALALGNLGLGAVRHAIQHFKARKNKDNIETFVENIADGIEHSEALPVPKEHAASGSEYRKAIGKHIQGSAAHITQVIKKSFPQFKPAVAGLNKLRKGEPMDKEHKDALKGLGKFAATAAIATLPGGLAAHLAAGAATAAASYAFKKIRSGEIHGSLIEHFVSWVGEGLEEAVITGE